MPWRFFKGNGLRVFDQLATLVTSETGDTFKEVLTGLTHHVFPKQASQTQKRFMRRFLKKPADMLTRVYITRIAKIHGILKRFPKVSGYNVESLQQDELLYLHKFGMPNQWQSQMILQDFDPVDHTIEYFVNFCDRMELTYPQEQGIDSKDKSSSKNTSSSSTGSSRSLDKRKQHSDLSGTQQKGILTCLFHGEGNHSFADFFALKNGTGSESDQSKVL